MRARLRLDVVADEACYDRNATGSTRALAPLSFEVCYRDFERADLFETAGENSLGVVAGASQPKKKVSRLSKSGQMCVSQPMEIASLHLCSVAMPQYRVYRLDETGHVSTPPSIIEADSDAEAVEQLMPLAEVATIEIWNEARLIGVIRRRDNPAPPIDDN